MRIVAKVGDRTQLVRLGRDGKNRYCLYYNEYMGQAFAVRSRIYVVRALTKSAAHGMFKLMKEP